MSFLPPQWSGLGPESSLLVRISERRARTQNSGLRTASDCPTSWPRAACPSTFGVQFSVCRGSDDCIHQLLGWWGLCSLVFGKANIIGWRHLQVLRAILSSVSVQLGFLGCGNGASIISLWRTNSMTLRVSWWTDAFISILCFPQIHFSSYRWSTPLLQL